jgi:uncharacterized membrane protein
VEARVTRTRDLGWPLLASAAFAVGGWALISFAHVFAYWLFGDARFYSNWGSWIASHRVPYRDFNLEYPPGSVPLFVAPVYLRKLFGYHGTYFFWLRVEILACQLLGLVAMTWALAHLRASRRRAYAALCTAGVASAVLGPIAFFHYDAFPALLAVAALAALLAGRGVLACAFAAAGAVTKVFPIVLIPFALIELWRRGRWRGLAAGFGAALAVVAVVVGPFAVIAPHGLSWSLHREARRPLEDESLGSSIFVAAHELVGYHLHIVISAGSHNFGGAGPHAVVRVLTVLTVVGLMGVYLAWLRTRREPDDLVLAAVIAFVVYIAFSKVFSPQYLVWLIPLVPLIGGRLGVRASALLLVLLGVTQIFEPYNQGRYWKFETPWIDWTVVARNVLVLVLLGMLTLPLLRRAGVLRHRETAAAAPVDLNVPGRP